MGMKKRAKLSRSDLFRIVFFSLFGLCILGSLIIGIKTRGASFAVTLFHAESISTNKDFFMDFFNSMRDASDMSVYEKGVIYPPLANLLFLMFSKMISPVLASSSFSLRYSLEMDQISIVIYLVFCFICVAAFSMMIKEYLSEGKAAVAQVLSFSVIFMYPFYYCIERGNILLLAMVLTAFFVFFYNSKSRAVREIAYLMLALAAGLKIYPAFFGLILIQEKKYRAAAKTVIYGMLFFFVPFLFYDGGLSIFTFIDNIRAFSQNSKAAYSLGSTSVLNLFYYLGDKYVGFGKAVFLLSEVIAAVFVFIAPKKWQKIFLLTYMMINIPSVSSTYASVFMIIPFIVLMANSTKKDRSDWIYFVLFCLVLLPIPCLYYGHPSAVKAFFDLINIGVSYSVNKLLAWPSVQFIFILTVVESAAAFISEVKAGKPVSSYFYEKTGKKSKKPQKKVQTA